MKHIILLISFFVLTNCFGEKEISVGTSMTSGNTDSIAISIAAKAKEESNKNKFEYGAKINYEKQKIDEIEAETIDNTEIEAEYNRKIGQKSKQKIYILAKETLFMDKIASIKYRFTTSTGVGYQTKKDLFVINFELGPSYIFEEKENQLSDYLSIRVGVDAKQFMVATLYQDVEILVRVDEKNDIIAKVIVGIETEITKASSLKIEVEDRYESHPANDRKDNDLVVRLYGAYKF